MYTRPNHWFESLSAPRLNTWTLQIVVSWKDCSARCTSEIRKYRKHLRLDRMIDNGSLDWAKFHARVNSDVQKLLSYVDEQWQWQNDLTDFYCACHELDLSFNLHIIVLKSICHIINNSTEVVSETLDYYLSSLETCHRWWVLTAYYSDRLWKMIPIQHQSSHHYGILPWCHFGFLNWHLY